MILLSTVFYFPKVLFLAAMDGGNTTKYMLLPCQTPAFTISFFRLSDKPLYQSTEPASSRS
jgi:hypothetical protein